MKKVLFIINPNSGITQKKKIELYASKVLSKNDFQLEYAYTKYVGHATEISKNAVGKFDIIVAVGGDGTIHEIAQHVIHSKTCLAIVPMGSGNGFANFFNISNSPKKAISQIATGKEKIIDTILCNDEFFINVAGIGFDAQIGDIYDKTPHRGGLKYIKLIGKELQTYPSQTYTFITNNEEFTKTFFIASIANSSQWGLNAHIAPLADICDGKFDLVFIKKFPLYKSINLTLKLFSKRIQKSKYVETIQLEELTIKNDSECLIHLDGESRKYSTDIHFSIQKKSLKIIV